MPVLSFLQGMHKWQKDIWQRFDNRSARFFMTCWHRRSRKTTNWLNILIRECCNHPKSIYTYVAPFYAQARSIAWDDPKMLDAYLPDKEDMYYVKNETKMQVKFQNQSLLKFVGADKLDTLRGFDTDGIVFDEYALMKEGIWTEIYRPIIAQNKSRWATFSFTPKGDNHVHELWNRSFSMDDWHSSFLPASVSGILSQEELDKARADMPDALYRQEFECEFITEEERTLITSAMLHALKGISHNRKETVKVIGVDPATGGNECVAYYFENEKIIDALYLYEKDPMKITARLMIFAAQHKTDNFAIDAIGIGSGIGYRLRELKKKVVLIESAGKASNPLRYVNKRAEIWWYVAQEIRDKEVDYPEDPELRRQLTNTLFDPAHSSGKIFMESKKTNYDRLKRHNDRADAFVYGIWGLKHFEGKPNREDFRKKRLVRSPMAA